MDADPYDSDTNNSAHGKIKAVEACKLGQVETDICEHSSDTDSSTENTEEEIYRNKFLILSDCDKLVGSSEPTSEIEDCTVSPPVPLGTIVSMRQTEKISSPPSGGARPKRSLKESRIAINSSEETSDDDEVT